jgi:hypothetical protein
MAVFDVVNLSGLLDEAKWFPAYQPICPLGVDGAAGEAGEACGGAA